MLKAEEKLGKPYIAFMTYKGLCIDLDDITYEKVLKVCERLLKKHGLEGYLIVESSPKHYHAIFNRPIEWRTIMQILFRFRKMSIEAWAKRQAQKGFLALRVNDAKHGIQPKPIKQKGETDKLISAYLDILNEFGEHRT